MRRTSAALASCLLTLPGVASAVESTLSQAGFTGLGITPNAHLIGWGRADFAYDNEIAGFVGRTRGHNLVLGFGLLPNLEVVGRIATSEYNSNCFVTRCGIRDLSASMKAGIGLDAANRFHAAAGVADFGGAATNFRSYYGVLTFNEGPFELSGGIARRSARSATRSSPLHGPFASAVWQPLPLLRTHVEYADSNAYGGVRLFAPSQWLPDGWAAHVGANVRLTSSNLTSRTWYSFGVSIPLYKVPPLAGTTAPRAPLPTLEGGQQPLPAYEARALPPATGGAVGPAAGAAVGPSLRAATDSDLQRLAEALRAKGLEDISVGRMPDGSVAVRANNATYNWNSLDALGAALNAVAGNLGDTKTAYRLVLTQRQLPLVAITGQTDCLRQWIQSENPTCAAGELSTPGTGALEPLQAGVNWIVDGLQPSWRTVRVAISPVLRTNIATEVGTFDYSAGVNLGFRLPLWAGADVEWRVEGEAAHSDDYVPGGVFGARRIRSGTERLAFTQSVRLPFERWVAPGTDLQGKRWGLSGVTAQATVGRVGRNYDGAIGSIRWEPGEGLHRFGAQAGYFRNNDFGTVPGEPRKAKPLLAEYRYNVAATRTYLEATAGQFMRNDQGVQFGLRQWFTDLSVSAIIRRTKFDSSSPRTFVGVELSIPIGPRRDMNPGGVQVTGTPRFSHGVYTVTGQRANAVSSGYGLFPPVPTLDSAFNSDRSSLSYFEDNIRRIRDSAR